MKKLLGLLSCISLCAMLLLGTAGCPAAKKDEKKVTTTDNKKVTEEKTNKEIKTTTEEKTDSGTKKTTVEETKKKLTVKAPADATVTQGETATINVDITRDKFHDPVELKFAGLPDGVSILEKDLTIAKDVTSAKVTLKAAVDAKVVDDQKVTVTASGGGITQEATVKVSVKKKATEKKTEDKKTEDKKTEEKKTEEKKTEDKKTEEKKTEEKKTGSLSIGVMNFYAQLNDRVLAPVYALRSLQVQAAYRAGRNEPRVTA